MNLTESWIGIKEAIDKIKQLDPETAVTENCLRNWIKEGKIEYIEGLRYKKLINWEDLVKFLDGKVEPIDPRESQLEEFFQNYYDPQAGYLTDSAYVNRLARDTLKFLNSIK